MRSMKASKQGHCAEGWAIMGITLWGADGFYLWIKKGGSFQEHKGVERSLNNFHFLGPQGSEVFDISHQRRSQRRRVGSIGHK